MNHQKEDVLPKAAALWPDILTNLAGIDGVLFDHKKEHPCPLCGGKTRFRYRTKPAGLDRPFYCNNCGSRSGLELFIDYTGTDYSSAINAIGNYIGNIPQEKIEVKQREFEIKATFPYWYKFDTGLYNSIKEAAAVDLSAWQRVNGLNMLDILKHGNDALVPLLDKNGQPVDFVMIDIDGNYKTTAGNTIIPSELHSVFGEKKGKYTYIAVNPFHAARASIFTQRQVVCCYEVENIWEVAKHGDEPPVVIVTNLTETEEADQLKFNQLIFNVKNNTVNRRLYKPGEIMKERKGNGHK